MTSETSPPSPGGFASFSQRVGRVVHHARFQNFILAVILLNAAILGLETAEESLAGYLNWLHWADRICLAIFVIEIGLKLIADRLRFFRSGWNIFDFLIVSIALVPATGELSVLRAFRILRATRLLSVVPAMRRIVAALLHALPGVASAGSLLIVVFYIGAVMTTTLYGDTFPQWFGTIGASAYSLFQIMTLESWSMGIVRPVMEVHPSAWAFFVPFILISSFTVLNVFIGIIVDAIAEIRADEIKAEIPVDPEGSQLERIDERLARIEAALKLRG